MTFSQFYSSQKICLLVSTFVLMSVVIKPASRLIDMVLDIDAIALLELSDFNDSNKENEPSESNENPFEKKNPQQQKLYWVGSYIVFSDLMKLHLTQQHESVFMEIVLPPPESIA